MKPDEEAIEECERMKRVQDGLRETVGLGVVKELMSEQYARQSPFQKSSLPSSLPFALETLGTVFLRLPLKTSEVRDWLCWVC